VRCHDTGHDNNGTSAIRTSGEQRISNFLLWQFAYAEILVAVSTVKMASFGQVTLGARQLAHDRGTGLRADGAK